MISKCFTKCDSYSVEKIKSAQQMVLEQLDDYMEESEPDLYSHHHGIQSSIHLSKLVEPYAYCACVRACVCVCVFLAHEM